MKPDSKTCPCGPAAPQVRRGHVRAVASIAFCLACLSASGADADNPYVGIVDRNVFQLRPPVLVPPVTNPQPPAVVSKLTLTGITTIFGKPLALLTTQPTGKPQDAGKREHYSLRVGQRMDGIEVLSIDAKKGVVRVKNNGAEETLDFINNGAKLVAAAAPGHPSATGVPNPIQRPSPVAGRQLPTAQSGGYAGSYAGSSGNAAPGQSGNIGYAARRSGYYTGPQAQPNAPATNLDPSTQAIMIEVERERTREQVLSGQLPPLPPTALTPEGAPGSPPPIPGL